MTDFASLVSRGDQAVQKHLGGAVTYAPSAGQAVSVRGVFDEDYVLVESGNTGVSTSGPAVFLTLSDLPSDPQTDVNAVITVAGKSYKSREVQKDGIGGALLLLERA